MHLKNAAGRPHRPKDRKIPYWHDHFLVPGKIVLTLPLGHYTFEIERGPQYTVRTGHFTINRFADDAKEVEMRRHVDMSAEGWYSGDLDVRRPIREIPLIAEAEDLNVIQVVTWPSKGGPLDSTGAAEQLLVPLNHDRYYHVMAGSHRWPGGSLLFFNLNRPLDVSDEGPEYPSPVEYVKQAREHPWAWVDLSTPSSWDLPMLVAHGHIDSIQIANRYLRAEKVAAVEIDAKPRDKLLYPEPWGQVQWSQAIYFHLLNCGLRIPPSAGSGSGDSPNPAGYNRVYVHVDGELSYEKWWKNFKAGRVTITNGPLLRPNVEGQLPGHVFRGQPGQLLEFEIGLTLSIRDPISYLEIIKNGEVEHSIRFAKYAESGRLPMLQFDQSGWFLIRAVTDLSKTYRFAMAAPYYVEFDYEPRISRASAQFFLDWVYQRARQMRIDDPSKHREVLDQHREARDFWRELGNRANAE
jgi:hypothetical protein